MDMIQSITERRLELRRKAGAKNRPKPSWYRRYWLPRSLIYLFTTHDTLEEMFLKVLIFPTFGLATLAWLIVLGVAINHDHAVWTLPALAWGVCAVAGGFVLVAWRKEALAPAPIARPAPTPHEAILAECYDEPHNRGEDMDQLDFVPQLDLQEAIRTFVNDHPEYERRLGEIVAWEKLHPMTNEYDGWSWFATHTPARMCTQLVGAGVLNVVYDSRASTQYRLVSLADTEEALANLHLVPNPNSAPDLSSLFRFVVGNDRAKQILLSAIEADKAVHVLLTGPPGTAKTLMLTDIGSLPGAEFYAGSTTTGPGLVNLLLTKKPKYLVIDEIDKMATEDMTPLLNLMEGGVVTRLQVKQQQRETMDTRVFAGGNDMGRLSAPIISRFARIHIPAYTAAEFVSVAQAVLVQREGIGPTVAMLIATSVVGHSTDIRDAVRVARLARGKVANVEPVVASLFSDRQNPLPFGAGR